MPPSSVHSHIPLWRVGDNIQQSVASFHHVGPGDRTQVDSKYNLYTLRHFSGPQSRFCFFFKSHKLPMGTLVVSPKKNYW